MNRFREMLEAQWADDKFVCVGLDSELGKIPECISLESKEGTVTEFNHLIVNATKDIALAYKLNLAFYVALGDAGLRALMRTIDYIHIVAPGVPVILDAKSMDIGNTNLGYIQMAFEYCKADAVTVNPYLGREAAQPFLDQKDKGVIVLCRTSNKGAGEFQDLMVSISNPRPPGLCMESDTGSHLVPMYQVVARNVTKRWNTNGNCAVVVGATYPKELAEVRGIVGDMPILIPGLGAQGGDAEATVKAGMDNRKRGMIINSSRGIIFASDGPGFADAARREAQKLGSLINHYRG